MVYIITKCFPLNMKPLIKETVLLAKISRIPVVQ